MSNLAENVSVVFNVAKSCLGAGIYSYPKMFYLYGVVPVLIMTILSGAASVLGAFAYIDLNSKFSKKNTISSISTLVVSKGCNYLVDAVVVIKCLAVAAGYLSFSREIMRNIPVNSGLQVIDKNPTFFAHLFSLVSCVFLLPSMLGVTLAKLKNFSYLGTFSIALLIIVSIIRTSGCSRSFSAFTDNFNVINHIGGFVFGFNCHQSILNIHNEIVISGRNMKMLVSIAFALVAVFYLLFGFVNYSAFGSQLGGVLSLFEIWGHSSYTNISAFLFAGSLLLSVPFQIHPAKTYLSQMLQLNEKNTAIVTVLMLIGCYTLSCQSWYDIDYVSMNVTRPMNILLCFGFPLVFTLCSSEKKKMSDWLSCLYLTIFIGICIASFFC